MLSADMVGGPQGNPFHISDEEIAAREKQLMRSEALGMAAESFAGVKCETSSILFRALEFQRFIETGEISK